MPAAHEQVGLTIGTHTWSSNDPKIDKIVEQMRKHGIKTMDTARVYVNPSLPVSRPALTTILKGAGESETAIGMRGLAREFSVDTKANTALIPGSGKNIASDAAASLKALQTEKVSLPSN
jgi:aflatoxin B1 aldehyde reductase